MLYEVGVLDKGDPCIVHLQGRKSWFCRVASSLPYDNQTNSLYECVTPHGSVVIAGAAWVRAMSDEEKNTLLSLEESARQKGIVLYKGKIFSCL